MRGLIACSALVAAFCFGGLVGGAITEQRPTPALRSCMYLLEASGKQADICIVALKQCKGTP